MNSIYKYILLLFFGFGLQQVQSQSYHFKTSGFSVLEKNEKGKWGQWSNLDLVNLSVVLDTDKHRIVVYSQEIQLLIFWIILSVKKTIRTSFILLCAKTMTDANVSSQLLPEKNKIIVNSCILTMMTIL